MNRPLITGALTVSPDGTQWWDGTNWQPIANEAPPDALRSPDGQHWWDGQQWVAFSSASAPQQVAAAPAMPTMRDVGSISAEKVASVGTLIVAATLIIVSAFLTWYTFQTQGGFPVQGQSGLTNGYGIWALILGGYTVVNAIVVAVAASSRAMKVAVRALWTDFVLVCIALVLGIVELSSGGWVVVGTTIPLVSSPGPGLYLLGTAALALLIAVIRLTVFLRKRAWSWSAPPTFA